MANKRHKSYEAVGFLGLSFASEKENEAFFTREMIPYYTQCEVAVGTFFPSIRLGFNPGELLDFILGWTTIDIFRDDLEKDEPVGQEE